VAAAERDAENYYYQRQVPGESMSALFLANGGLLAGGRGTSVIQQRMDFQDVMAGVDHCITLGVADPERLGIAGLSYGGYMAGWAVTQTDRFKAAVAMSVVSNYVSFHLTSEVWMYDEMILEGEWNDPTSQYVERSPVTHAHRCRTPTLVLQGAEDRCTPVGQGWELANAIAATGTEVELVVYPREGHVPMERAHALDAIRRTQAWFDRHLRREG
jgi:dipeptidyl aminopeptidase/acylaminoacyl peptidase